MTLAAKEASAPGATTDNKIWQVILAAGVGTMIEWYDFFLIGSLTVVLALKFYPPGNATFAYLAYLATFAIASRHYVIDRSRGAITFGGGDRGLIPLAGKNNIKCAQYQYGGGAKGNVDAGAITKLRTTIPFIASVTNPSAADGGGDEEGLDRVQERGPQTLKHRDRAVTWEDFEWLVREASPKVAKVRCLPTRDPSLRFRPDRKSTRLNSSH